MTLTIMELGGNPNRLQKVIELAAQYPDAPIVISSEAPAQQVIAIMDGAGISRSRWTLDYTAWDTVTNFTCTLPLLRKLNTDKVLVVTDGFHMKRAMRIATAVYFNNGIEPVAEPSSPVDHKEDPKLVRFDTARAWLWRATGQLLASQNVYDDRIGYLQNEYYVARTLL
jgi:uncharacterized SAM-binding protein YcdF (DUF218 family)